ncbi:hypothetical protein [Frankia sp. AgKG'84/4]|uniref:hypothetical protein n=1 Tax=Frankia sp. AgKG'84/4 TaxID=573490 RepID=UPI00200C89A1|nr:hypothetical protein [Frankia sp. AgKG'84/4]MCL9796250.1 hypothetical protein [Frankia sp. AgKG'84/4]
MLLCLSMWAARIQALLSMLLACRRSTAIYVKMQRVTWCIEPTSAVRLTRQLKTVK